MRALEAGKALRGRQGHGPDDRRGRRDDRGPRPIGSDALGLPQSALGLGLRHHQGGAGPGADRPSALVRELGLPALHAPDLARQADEAGTILHDWGAHLVDQALQLGLGPCRRLAAWVLDSPWEGVDSGGHGRIVMEFDQAIFQAETSRVCRIDRPRWWIVGTEGGFVEIWRRSPGRRPPRRRYRPGLRAGEPSRASSASRPPSGEIVESRIPSIRAHWDQYYANIADHLLHHEPLAVTAEQAREVVQRTRGRGAVVARDHLIDGPWGT